MGEMNRKILLRSILLLCLVFLNITLWIHTKVSLMHIIGNEGSYYDDIYSLLVTSEENKKVSKPNYRTLKDTSIHFDANLTWKSNHTMRNEKNSHLVGDENRYHERYDGCCILAHKADTMKAVDTCKMTCFTERACRDKAYPFASQEEKANFTYVPNEKANKELRKRCAASMEKKITFNWCRKASNGIESNVVNNSPTTVPAGCSQFSQGGRSGPYQNLLIFPAGKLAFCGIPKVGITQWKQFQRFTFGAQDYLSLPHFKIDTHAFEFDRLPPDVQSSILRDPSWTKAVFLRDPAERLLSAYLDKKKGIEKRFEIVGINVTTFVDFVEIVTTPNDTCTSKKNSASNERGLTWCSDPHWRPQALSCGLNEMLPNFQFIGSLDRVRDQTRILLDRVGMWETHGKRYMFKKMGKEDSLCEVRRPKQHDEGVVSAEAFMTGFQQQYSKDGSDGADVYGHAKSAKANLEKYYTPVLLEMVKRAYAMDYELWNALQLPSNHNGTNGKYLAATLNAECR